MKSLVIHKLHLISSNKSNTIVSRIIPLHQNVKWVDYDNKKNSLQITYLNDDVDVYISLDKNDSSLKDAVDKLFLYNKDNIIL